MPDMTEVAPERSEEPTQQEYRPGQEERREGPEIESTRRAAEILARALSEAEEALRRPAPGVAPVAGELMTPPPEEGESVIRTLAEHFDRALDRMAEERRLLVDEVLSGSRSLREYFDRVEDRMDHDRRTLSDQVVSLGRAVERLERRLEEICAQVAQLRPVEKPQAATEATAPVAEPQVPAEEAEPAFLPGGEGLTLVISAVPGFQGLMEAQRALTRLSAVEGASVERYFDGEARIVLALSEPVTASRLVETLSEATGQEAQIEESRPEALRLRVRFQPAG